jgi:hypothetical protein
MVESTCVEAVDLQPLVVFVTVNTYVAPTLTVGLQLVEPETIFPPLGDPHCKVKLAPELEPVQLNVVVGLLQLKLPFAVATALGGVIFPVMVPMAVLVQLLLSVTVTV